jgi:hypothetical protein
MLSIERGGSMNRIVLGLTVSCVLGFVTVNAQNGPAGGQMGMNQMQMMQACPMKVEGTTVEVADTADGVAVTFTAKPANVADLQQRVERMANMHSSRGNMPMGQKAMLAGTVKYEALPTGARLTLKPNDASKLKEFREQVRSHAEQMKKGECAMMQDMMMHGMMMQGKSGGADKK